jgi:hypothetical protein
MAGKKLQNKTTNNTTTTPAAVEVAAVEVAAVEVASVQKGGRKTKTAAASTTPTTPVATVDAAPVAASVATPVATPVATAAVTPQKGGRKAKAASATAVEVTATVTEVTPVQKGGKKAKVQKVDVPVVNVTVTDADAVVTERHIRSFKVKLPNKEEFEGRFTGLTPYQAANKALSKYFRETDTPSAEITFSICESTRKSKKSVYTYVGKRQKLDIPVTYKIQDGREIVKNFKNSLKKVKKSETTVSASA